MCVPANTRWEGFGMRRRVGRLFLVMALSLWSATAWALPAAACSCMAFEGMKAYVGDPLKQIFTGTITASGQDGALVAVDRWFQGTGEATVRLAGGFGNQSAACQVMPPPVGSRWLYVAFIPNPGDPPQVNLCTPQARLGAAGAAVVEMEREAIAVFGAGLAPSIEPHEPPPAVVPTAVAQDMIPMIAAGIGATVMLLFGGLALLARRRPS
jgi:hypothetical protein